MFQGAKSTHIIIDALDECPTHGGERTQLLDLLRFLAASQAPSVHILVTSRREQNIEENLATLVTLPPLGIQEENTDADVAVHVDAQLEKDNTMSKWPEPIKLETKEALTTKANGMYVHAIFGISGRY